MPTRKKTEETEAATEDMPVETEVIEAADEAAVEAKADSPEEPDEAATAEDKPKRAKKAKAKDAEETAATEEPSIVDSVIDAVSAVVGSVAEAVSAGVSTIVEAVGGTTDDDAESKKPRSKRAEKIGVVSSDKMMKTVVVRVDRLIKHPVYRKYVRRKKNFMAHDETGATIGDKVRIVETRPLSARKRWRVAEIIQKAEK